MCHKLPTACLLLFLGCAPEPPPAPPAKATPAATPTGPALQQLVIANDHGMTILEGYAKPDSKFVLHGRATKILDDDSQVPPLMGVFVHGELIATGPPGEREPVAPGDLEEFTAEFLHGLCDDDADVSVQDIEPAPETLSLGTVSLP